MQSTTTTSSVTRLELIHGLDANEVGARLRDASDELGRNKRVLAFYLFDMDERRLAQLSGHGSTVHFAETQLDLEARRVREFIQVGRSLQSLTLIDEAFCNGEISWSRVVMLLPVVQRETQQGWLEYAKTATCRDLRAEVSGCRPGDLPGEGSDYGLIHLKVNFQARLGDTDLSWVEQARMQLSRSPENLLTDTELLVELSRRVLVDGERPPRGSEVHPSAAHPSAVHPSRAHPSEALPKAERNDQEVPDETRDEVLRRDQHRCRNCNCHLDVQVHHVLPRSQGGSNLSHNLVTLCGICHASAHRSLLVISGDPNHEVWFTSNTGHPIQRGGHPLPARRA